MKRILAVGAGLVLLAVVWLAWRQPDTPPDSNAVPVATSPSPTQTAAATPLPAANAGPRVVSVRDQSLRLDAAGNLVPGPEVRLLFTTLARDQGQVAVDLWKQNVLQPYRDSLGPVAFRQLQSLLNRYVEYDLALQLLPMDGVATLDDALAHIRQVRGDYLGSAAQPLFQDWRQLESFTSQFVTQVVNQAPGDNLQQNLREQAYALPASVQPRALQVLEHSADLLNALPGAESDPALVRGAVEQVAAMALIQPTFVFSDPEPGFLQQYLAYQQAREQLQRQQNISSEQAPELVALRHEYFTDSHSDRLRARTLDRAEMY